MFTYYTSRIVELLNQLLKKDALFEIGPKQRTAFEEMKQLACKAPVLAFFRPGRLIYIKTNAS